MELVQGFTRRQEIEKIPTAGGLAGWIVGALQGRIRIKWRANGRGTLQEMNVLQTMPLGGKKQLMLVECHGERYLVGCGSDSVTAIAKAGPEFFDGRPGIKPVAQPWL